MHDSNIHKTEKDVAMATMCPFPPGVHDLLHYKCVLHLVSILDHTYYMIIDRAIEAPGHGEDFVVRPKDIDKNIYKHY